MVSLEKMVLFANLPLPSTFVYAYARLYVPTSSEAKKTVKMTLLPSNLLVMVLLAWIIALQKWLIKLKEIESENMV